MARGGDKKRRSFLLRLWKTFEAFLEGVRTYVLKPEQRIFLKVETFWQFNIVFLFIFRCLYIESQLWPSSPLNIKVPRRSSFFSPRNFVWSAFHFQVLTEAIVVVLLGLLIVFIKIVGLFFVQERLDKRETVIQCPYFTSTLTAYTFGVIVVLHKTELWKAAQLRQR